MKKKQGYQDMVLKRIIKGFIRFGRGSLLIQTAKIAVIWFVGTWALFTIVLAIMSHDSQFTADVLTDYLNWDQCKIESLDIDCKSVRCELEGDTGDLVFFDGVCEIGGETFGDNEKTEATFINVSKVSDNAEMWISAYNGDSFRCALGNNENINEYENSRGTEYIKYNETEYDSWIDMRTTDFLKYSGDLCVYLTGYNIKLIGEKIGREPKTFQGEPGKTITVYFPQGADKLHVYGTDHIEIHSPVVKYVNISNVNEQTMDGNGDVSWHYYPESEEYKIKNQELYLKSLNGAITAKISVNEDGYYRAQCSGKVTEIKLSGNSLMPTYFNFIKKNLLVIPLSLIPILGGGISMITLYKKDDEKNNNHRPE